MDDKHTTPLQDATIAHAIKKLYKTEKIVNHDLDLSKWKIKQLYKDVLWVQLLDEPAADTIVKNGIALPVSQTKGLFRLGKVIMCGPDTQYAKVGEIIRFSQGVGMPYEKIVDGFKTWLIREDAVIAVVEFDGTESEMEENLENEFHLSR
jgi:co-chaperonin GroES (HSP10)